MSKYFLNLPLSSQENLVMTEWKTAASLYIAVEAENLQKVINTYKIEDTKFLPTKHDSYRIILNVITNKKYRDENLLDIKETKELALNIPQSKICEKST